VRSWAEQSAETGIRLESETMKSNFNETIGFIALTRNDTSYSSYRMRDIHGSFTQKYRIVKDFHAYLEEGLGWAAKKPENVPFRAVDPDSSIYTYLKQGLLWEAFDRGFAEASYTVSLVNIPGELDYRMASGYPGGLTHIVSVSADVKTGDHLSINLGYRTDFNKPFSAAKFLPASHTLSMEVKAFL